MIASLYITQAWALNGFFGALTDCLISPNTCIARLEIPEGTWVIQKTYERFMRAMRASNIRLLGLSTDVWYSLKP